MVKLKKRKYFKKGQQNQSHRLKKAKNPKNKKPKKVGKKREKTEKMDIPFFLLATFTQHFATKKCTRFSDRIVTLVMLTCQKK